MDYGLPKKEDLTREESGRLRKVATNGTEKDLELIMNSKTASANEKKVAEVFYYSLKPDGDTSAYSAVMALLSLVDSAKAFENQIASIMADQLKNIQPEFLQLSDAEVEVIYKNDSETMGRRLVARTEFYRRQNWNGDIFQ